MNTGMKEGLSQYARDEAPRSTGAKAEGRYPKGWLPTCFILAVFAVLVGVTLGVSVPAGKIAVYDAPMIAFVVCFGLCFFWLTLRQNFAMQSRYGMSKIGRQLTAYRWRARRD